MGVGAEDPRRRHLDGLGGLPLLAGHGVDDRDLQALDVLDAVDRLNLRVQLRGEQAASEGPSIALGSSGQRMDEPVEALLDASLTRLGSDCCWAFTRVRTDSHM